MPPINKSPNKNGLIYLVIIALFITAFYIISNAGQTPSKEITFSSFINKVEAETVNRVNVTDNKVSIELIDGSEEHFYKESGTSLYELLDRAEIDRNTIINLPIEVKDTEGTKFWRDILIGLKTYP